MKRNSLIIGIVAVAMIALGGATIYRIKANQRLGQPGLKTVAKADGSLMIPLPETVLDYASKEMESTEAERAMLPKDTTFAKRLYAAPDGFHVFTSVVMMGADRTSIHKPEFCLKGMGWDIADKETLHVPMRRPREYDLPVRLFTVAGNKKGADGKIAPTKGYYAFWFVADNALTDDHWARQGLLAQELLRTGTLQRWAYVAMLVVFHPGQEDVALARLKTFIQSAVPEFQETTGPAAGRAIATTVNP